MSERPLVDPPEDEPLGAKFQRLAEALGMDYQAAFSLYNELKAESGTRATLEEITAVAAALPPGEKTKARIAAMIKDLPPSESSPAGPERQPAPPTTPRRIEWSEQNPPAPPSAARPGEARPAPRRSRLDRLRTDLGRLFTGEVGSAGQAPTPAPPQPAAPRHTPKAQPPKAGSIDWANPAGSELDPASLVGVEDAYEHTPLLPGEKVAFCQYDRVAYHLETWNFLKAENHGRCCACGQVGTIRLVQLPGELAAPEKPEPRRVPAWMETGEEVIGLKQVHEYVGRAVIVEDFVTEVYLTKSNGTHYIRFEERRPGQPVFEGFKVVVFKDYQSAWQRAGIDMQQYAGKRVRVRGIIQVHPMWGIEILINSPAMIQVVAKSGGGER